MATKRIAVVTPRNATGETGGAERFYAGLVDALRAAGAAAEQVDVEVDESTFPAVLQSVLRVYDLDLSRFDGVISTKFPTYCVRHPNHVAYLVHTMRVFYDMFDAERPAPTAEHCRQRDLIRDVDTACLARARRVFAIGREVADRLAQWNGIHADVLHPALDADRFDRGPFEHVFLASRLHRWKRIDLLVEAFQHVRAPIPLRIAGVGEEADALRALGSGDPRIEFLGRVSDDELVRLYAQALVVPFFPLREDYGYVTIEAFRSGKPVITCTDSGEPTAFVRDGENGYVCPPDPRTIADRIDRLAADPSRARSMGENGRRSVRHIQWQPIAQTLLDALGVTSPVILETSR